MQKDIREYPEYSISNLLLASFILFVTMIFAGFVCAFRYDVMQGVWLLVVGLVGMLSVYCVRVLWIEHMWKKARRSLR